MADFDRQMREMQKKISDAEADLKERVVEAAAGGGAVKVKVNGALEVVHVVIDTAALADKAMLEDLVLTAANEAVKKARAMRDREMTRVTGRLGPLGM